MAEYTRADLKAGVVIIIGVTLCFALLVYVSDYQDFMSPKQSVEAVFEDVQGLKVNDPIRYAGQRVGKVEALRIVASKDIKFAGDQKRDENRPALTNRYVVVVSLRMEQKYQVCVDDVIMVNKTLTGGLTVDIEPTGKGAVWKAGDPPIRGTEYPGLQEYAQRLGKMLDKADGAIDSFKPRVVKVLDGADGLIATFQKTFSEKEQEKLKNTITNLEKTSVNIESLSKRVNEIVGKDGSASKTVAEVREILKKVDTLLTEAQPDIKTSIANLKDASAKIGTFSTKASGLIGDLNTLVDRNRDKLGDAAASLKTMSGNLLSWSEDVKRHPWVLLRKPDEDDIVKKELGYTADQLKQGLASADKTVERLLQVSQKKEMSPEEAKRLTTELKEIMEEVRVLQKKLEKKLD